MRSEDRLLARVWIAVRWLQPSLSLINYFPLHSSIHSYLLVDWATSSINLCAGTSFTKSRASLSFVLGLALASVPSLLSLGRRLPSVLLLPPGPVVVTISPWFLL